MTVPDHMFEPLKKISCIKRGIHTWEKGLENIPETMITVRNIGSLKVREP
ncbi:MAG: hypothetical protein ACU0BN_06410 [Sulfitobacter sp.]|uniref:Uncharacterized protein n=1 Tax=Sulfitobacter litoralis TaxID=335975 RepID=A0ABY0SDV5_9RHOB|nr:hypothetical protein [Sulfitobacter litoralis]SDP12648.1 hypothetical protein SAMN04488512_1101 [Sulfitobacter litoralis]